MTTISMISQPSSAGIWRAAAEVAAALTEAGAAVDLVDQAERSGSNHFHLGNSTRKLLPSMAICAGSVVTVHDAVPRNPWLRRLIARPQSLLLERLHVVTHSSFAADLLRNAGWQGEATIVPSLLPVTTIDPALVASLRSAWGVERYQHTIVSAGEIRAAKGIDEIVGAAAHQPEILVVLLGRITEPAMERVIANAPPNVRHVEAPTDEAFCHAIAAADALLSLRRQSVGETSGPVIQAHRLNRPVLGLATGTLPEACGPGDLLLPADAGAVDLLAHARDVGLTPLPPDSPQIPRPADVAHRLLELYRSIGWET